MSFDLLTTVESGGCSAKLPANALADLLDKIPRPHHPRLLVDIDTHDDAGVYQLTDEIALVQTTDFFPPVCSDGYVFGQIAAANALSDVYAMGGTPLTAMNLVMFPAEGIPLEVLADILRGGMDKVSEAGALIVGGHTITDPVPKYGLAVTGSIHPQKIITNAAAQPGDILVLSKALGTGVLMAGHKIGEAPAQSYQYALDSMRQLNRDGGRIMQQFSIRCATDITGFGLLGHALKLALASQVTLRIDTFALPQLPDSYSLLDLGCIPGACFRNQAFVQSQTHFSAGLDYNLKMLALDAQTSGGLLACVTPERVHDYTQVMRNAGYPHTTVIGSVTPAGAKALEVR